MTPGPWIIAPPGGPQGPFYGMVNGKGNVVALQIVNEQDARLIAAAPELLAAARDVWGSFGTVESKLVRLGAVIAKAEGHES